MLVATPFPTARVNFSTLNSSRLCIKSVSADSQTATAGGHSWETTHARTSAASEDDKEDDDLDQLLDQYEEQAAAAARAVQQKKTKPLSQKGQIELREEGLGKRIDTDNR